MKFKIYSRKSVFTGKGESIENQVEMCRDYIFANFPGSEECDITVYEDGSSIIGPSQKAFQCERFLVWS